MRYLLIFTIIFSFKHFSFADESYLNLISKAEKSIVEIYGKGSIASEVAKERLMSIVKSSDSEEDKKKALKKLLSEITTKVSQANSQKTVPPEIVNKSEDLDKRYIDCLNILFTSFYILKESNDFNFVEKSIINNIDFSKVPKDLEPYFKRLLDICSQASTAQRAQVGTENYYSDAISKKVLGDISSVVIGIRDPMTAFFSSLNSAYDLDKKKKAQIRNIYLQYEQRLKSDEYDLIKESDRIKARLNLKENAVLSPELIKEFNKISLAGTSAEKLKLAQSYVEKYPEFIPVHGAIIEIICSDTNMWDQFRQLDKSFSKILKNPNSIFKVDPSFIKSSTSIGDVFMMIAFTEKLDNYSTSRSLLNFSKVSIDRYKNIPEFYLYRGVGTLLGSGISEECWKDLTIRSEGISSTKTNNIRNFWQCLALGSDDKFMTDEDFKNSCKKIFNDGQKNVEFLINQKKLNLDDKREAIFNEMSALNLSCHFKVGLVFLDLVVVNNSQFPVYNVSVKGTYKRKGKVKNVDYTINKIDAGKSVSIKKLGLKAGLEDNTDKIEIKAEF